MLKSNYKEEVESTLDLLREEIDKSIIEENIEEAFKKINKGMKALVGLDLNTIDSLSFNQVIDLITKVNQYNADKYAALGVLLYFQGYVYERIKDENKKLNYYEKALSSFYKAYEEDDSVENKYIKDVIHVLDSLNEYVMDLEVYREMFFLYEMCSQFDKAEDILFTMINTSNKDENIIKLGIDFYKRLNNLSEDQLEKGNLPLEEVQDSLNDLIKMQN